MPFFTPTAAALSWALVSPQARPPAPAPLTADQIIEKSIEATGGRDALAKMTSTVSKGVMQIAGREEHSIIEFYAKAPDKRLIVTNIEGFGETRQGFDGIVAWRQDPTGAVFELKGADLAAARAEAAFNPMLQWRYFYQSAVLKGKTRIGGRDAWAIVFAGKNSPPAVRYYDAETWLLVRQDLKVETAGGLLDATVTLSDYRDAGGGVQAPFTMKQTIPRIGEITIRMSEIRNNAELDDAIFSKPSPPTAERKQ
jgi:hypothetical protein